MKAGTNTTAAMREQTLEAIGVRIKQSPVERYLYVFAIDGKTITEQVGVRRMKWHGTKFKAEGFQRRLDNTRVSDIAHYLSSNPILPNALVVAFEKGSLDFEPLPNQEKDEPQWGKIIIRGKLREVNGRLEPLLEDQRIGYVIDGQHRLRGIEQSTLKEGTFPVCRRSSLSILRDVTRKRGLTAARDGDRLLCGEPSTGVILAKWGRLAYLVFPLRPKARLHDTHSHVFLRRVEGGLPRLLRQ